jgi:predicted ATPase
VAAVSDRPLVGRDRLLAELAAAAEAAAAGAGSVVVLTGEAGIGKTSVARSVAQTFSDRLAVSWGACSADRGAPPFWPWRPLVDIEPVAHAESRHRAIGEARFERLSALRARIVELARDQPRLHVIEDLQWADVASVLLLSHVGSHIVDVPLLVVATLRRGEPRPQQLDDAVEDLRRTARVHELGPLGDAEVSTLIRGAGAEPDERLLGLIRSRTGGNPLFVTELLRALPPHEPPEQQLRVVAERVPEGVHDLVERRLARLAPEVSDALMTASVIGTEGDVATLAAAGEIGVAEVLDLLDQARAAHVLEAAAPGRWQFRHQLVRDAVYASVTGADRARRHAAVLEVLATDPSTSATTLALHALAALPLSDVGDAVALAARAGESTFAQHAYEEAVAWFTRALDASPAGTPDPERAELLVRRGEAHRHLGEIDAARASFVCAAELTEDPALIARAALGYADPGADLGIAYRTEDRISTALLERAIASQQALDPLTVAQLEARLAAMLYFSDEPSKARQLARSALERARALGDPRPSARRPRWSTTRSSSVRRASPSSSTNRSDSSAGPARPDRWSRR